MSKSICLVMMCLLLSACKIVSTSVSGQTKVTGFGPATVAGTFVEVDPTFRCLPFGLNIPHQYGIKDQIDLFASQPGQTVDNATFINGCSDMLEPVENTGEIAIDNSGNVLTYQGRTFIRFVNKTLIEEDVSYVIRYPGHTCLPFMPDATPVDSVVDRIGFERQSDGSYKQFNWGDNCNDAIAVDDLESNVVKASYNSQFVLLPRGIYELAP